MLVSSPRTWGCFPPPRATGATLDVFPTHVGVFLKNMCRPSHPKSLPHARGGVSQFTRRLSGRNMSSPRTWGCFGSAVLLREPHGVFPTHVGVFPSSGLSGSRSICLPHARGGVSSNREQKYNMLASSPRTWGCFYTRRGNDLDTYVFPTHVGVFLHPPWERPGHLCLPHARGGVSTRQGGADSVRGSSPRTWGCFRNGDNECKSWRVFPTHVGVFLMEALEMSKERCLPHARGGVSDGHTALPGLRQSSPRTWGCFPLAGQFFH
ncbi:Domain of uncharacterised function (DUF2825) [Klebsiella pneumoniae]|nr:Domain of uncharacterised function (DUF2825) [Klebsiella pneumoniae]